MENTNITATNFEYVINDKINTVEVFADISDDHVMYNGQKLMICDYNWSLMFTPSKLPVTTNIGNRCFLEDFSMTTNMSWCLIDPDSWQ